MMNETTQLIDVNSYIPKVSMIFSKPIVGEIPGTKPKVEFKRIKIFTKNDDGTEGELVIPTGNLYSFGVSTNTNQQTGAISGYVFPLCLWSGSSPTPEEEKWIDLFNEIVDNCIDHLLINRAKIGKFELERNELEKQKGGLNPLYWKLEKSSMARVPDRGPTLYAKLIWDKKQDQILTKFYNSKNDKLIDPLKLLNKGCRVEEGVIKIESIFIGSCIALQVKLYEAVIEPNKEMKRLTKFRCLTISDSKSAAEEMEKSEYEEEDSDVESLM